MSTCSDADEPQPPPLPATQNPDQSCAHEGTSEGGEGDSEGEEARDHLHQHREKKQKLSKEERYALTRQHLKEEDKRWRNNRKQKFDALSPEERERIKLQSRQEEETRMKRMKMLFADAPSTLPSSSSSASTAPEGEREGSSECAAAPLKDSASAPSLSICVDMSLDHEHTDRERRSLLKQLCFGYGHIKRMAGDLSVRPLKLYITGLTAGRNSDGRLHEIMMLQGVGSWHVKACKESIWGAEEEGQASCSSSSSSSSSSCSTSATEGVAPSSTPAPTSSSPVPFPPSSYVILSPDASEVLTEFEPDKLYIIGGIVDRSVRSCGTLGLSKQHSIAARRLPIQEYIPSRQTHVLNVDSIIRLICLYVQYGGDWKRCLEEAVPLRKQGKSVNSANYRANLQPIGSSCDSDSDSDSACANPTADGDAGAHDGTVDERKRRRSNDDAHAGENER